MLDDAAVDRALVICAHPDDVDFGAAGTISSWTERGVAVTYCLVTDGDAGGFDPSFPRSEIGPLRRREQTAAAAAVGVKDLVFLGYPDGRLVVSLDLRRDLSRVIRQVRPERVVIQSPVRNLDRLFASHPDHLAAGEASICAVYPDARNEFTFTELMDEGHQPWTVAETWVMGGSTPNRYVDVTDHLERKFTALRAHESQHRDPEAMEARVRGWLALTAEQAGLAAGRSAEAFQVLDTA